jgi:hypothetical protein
VQQRDLDVVGDGHVILHCVQPPKYKVEDAYLVWYGTDALERDAAVRTAALPSGAFEEADAAAGVASRGELIWGV